MPRRPTSPSIRRFTDRLSATPALAFAVGTNSLFVKFGFALTAGDLAPADWDITVAANGGAPAAQTTSGSVATADGLVVLAVSGTPFKLPPEEEQAIVLTYTPANTQTDLKDAAGRTVAGFTYSSILPRISDWRKAAYLLMAEQGSEPAAPAAGYDAVFMDTDPRLSSKESDSTVHQYAWLTDVTSGDAAIAATVATLSSALTDLQTGVEPFDPGVLLYEQSGAPSTPASNNGMVYADNAGNLHYINDDARDGVVQAMSYAAVSSNTTLGVTHELVNVTANSIDITFPTAVGFTRQYTVKNSGAGTVTLKTTSSQTIDGNASGALTMAQWDSITVRSDGANWIIV